jgi:5-carboxyvanillate decarboxylase
MCYNSFQLSRCMSIVSNNIGLVACPFFCKVDIEVLITGAEAWSQGSILIKERRVKIIGIEEHFITQKYIDYMRTRTEPPRREISIENGNKTERQWTSATTSRLMSMDPSERISNLGEFRIKDMDEAGIDMQVLSLSFPSVEAFSATDGTMIAAAVNDEISAFIKKYPGRFAAFATIAAQDPVPAARELERAVKKLGLKGALITGHIQDHYLDEQKFWPVLEMAEKLDVPIYIHPKFPRADMIRPYLDYPGLSGAMLGYTADASLHAMRLILSGAFDKYPKLKIILGHMGEALPFWLWRMDSRFKSQQTFSAEATKMYGALSKTPSQYFRENFYVTTSGMFWHPALQFVTSVLGADRVMFAADYPYEDNREAVEFLQTAPISQEEKEKIAHLNAEKILKL